MNIFCVWLQRDDDDNFDNDVDHYGDEVVMTMRKKNWFWRRFTMLLVILILVSIMLIMMRK